MRHGFVLAFDMNPIVAAGDRDSQGISNFAEMLIARPKQGQQRFGISQRNRSFGHSSQRRHPGRAHKNSKTISLLTIADIQEETKGKPRRGKSMIYRRFWNIGNLKGLRTTGISARWPLRTVQPERLICGDSDGCNRKNGPPVVPHTYEVAPVALGRI